MLHYGDCLDVLKTLPDNSVDSLVTDPPAGIGFMGKAWDHDKGGRKQWAAWMETVMRECLRVMKPGAHGLVWAIPRTSHWTATALEDAGFEVRDVVTHLFGSGFPKNMDISKALDKAAGAEREVVGRQIYSAPDIRGNSYDQSHVGDRERLGVAITAPATDAAKQWQGWGTALKPASEHWILVRKPCSEKTVAANVLKWGVGGLNIDGCRIEPSKDYGRSAANSKGTINSHNGFEGKSFKIAERNAEYASTLGRFPANLVLSGDAPEMLDQQSGQDVSRFFYCAKTSTGERNAGMEGMPLKKRADINKMMGESGQMKTGSGNDRTTQFLNHHPTVKPQKLMRYLCRLITPPNGVVLDPFMGSGSTGLAAISEGFRFIGIEKEKEYFDISQKRIDHALASLF